MVTFYFKNKQFKIAYLDLRDIHNGFNGGFMRFLVIAGIITLSLALSGCAQWANTLNDDASGPAPGQTDTPMLGGHGGGPG